MIEQESQEGDDNFATKKNPAHVRHTHQVRWKNVHHGGHYSSSKDRKTYVKKNKDRKTEKKIMVCWRKT
jgi:hypothetical protein